MWLITKNNAANTESGVFLEIVYNHSETYWVLYFNDRRIKADIPSQEKAEALLQEIVMQSVRGFLHLDIDAVMRNIEQGTLAPLEERRAAARAASLAREAAAKEEQK